MPNPKLSPRTRLVLVTATAFVALLTVAASADAATRFASPAGTGADPTCQDPNPATACSLVAAIAAAASTDDVTLLGGTYPSLGTTLAIPDSVDVHGAVGAAVVIPTTAANGISVGTAATLSNVRVNHTGSNLGVMLAGTNATIAQSFVDSTGFAACAAPGLFPNDAGLIRDSVCWNKGAAGAGVSSFTQDIAQRITLRNVTAISAHGYAVESNAYTPGIQTTNATNVIASGATDLQAGGSNGEAHIFVDHSNFAFTNDVDGAGTNDTITDRGSNITTPGPAFTDAAGGDFHETAASTGTIDRGVAGIVNLVALGPLDLDGDVRIAGAAPDIGAYEFGSHPPDGGGGGGGGSSTTPGAAVPTGAPPKKCKKGRKLKRGKCVKKRKKKK